MLFNYHVFLQELKSKEEKKEIFEKYSKHFPDIINLSIEDQPWFNDYCDQFSIMNENDLNLPEMLENDFDWGVLQKLVAGSFSSIAKYIWNETGKWDIQIKVENEGYYITKNLSKLWSFQIKRLFEIYLEEQMNLQNHFIENQTENIEILKNRKIRLNKWNKMIQKKMLLEAIGLVE